MTFTHHRLAAEWLNSSPSERVAKENEHNFGGLLQPKSQFELVMGICAMKKKVSSAAMTAFIKELRKGIKIVLFPQEVILNSPIEEWPRCHCFIAFFSDGFPLEKAEAYALKYKPFLVNQIAPQYLLHDRRHVYTILKSYNVPVPRHIIMNRGWESPSGVPVPITEESKLEEYDDHIIVDGVRLDKPFVEKPVSGEDHNIYIYYPRHAGGGSKRLFRKIGDKSSEFYPDVNSIRREGSYIYEEFLATEGTDVKVYNVTAEYAHAEARKSPVVDGKVIRDKDGREMRYPIMLSNIEKEFSVKVGLAFGQRICGFDLLRSNGKSFVCDVNGFSFVKKNDKYYRDAASIVLNIVFRALNIKPILVEHKILSLDQDRGLIHPKMGENANSNSKMTHPHEELRCVIGVIRHGDRTPKQKLKMLVTNDRFLSLFTKYGGGTDFSVKGSELKLKSAAQLSDVLRATRERLDMYSDQAGGLDESDCEFDNVDKLRQVRTVLEMHGSFKGINRKIQLKPTKWLSATGSVSSKNSTPKVVEAMLILKWGGVLTSKGRHQAEDMGKSFRTQMYPGVDGLLRLHSTYRHDLKIYSSDEGRVQVTAAAFAKGLLDLDGHLTPILASLVRKSGKTNSLLDDSSNAKKELESVKKKLHHCLNNRTLDLKELKRMINPNNAKSIDNALGAIKNPEKAMRRLHESIKALTMQLTELTTQYQLRFGLANIIDIMSEVDSSQDNNKGVGRSSSSSECSNTLHETLNRKPSLGTISSNDEQNKPLGFQHYTSHEESTAEGGSAAASLGSRESELNIRILMAPRDKEGLLASGDMLHLGLARWKKLHKDFYHKKKDSFDLSKVPDIYDCAKYDVLHSPGLTQLKSGHLLNILHISKALADIIVPQEYGITMEDKFSIGRIICRSLLQKIRSDIFQSIKGCIPSNSSNSAMPSASANDSKNDSSFDVDEPPSNKNTTDNANANENDETETVHRLDPELARSMGIKSSNRHVRTRMYFTSESHLHSLFNVLRFAGVLASNEEENGDGKLNNNRKVPLVMSSAIEPLSNATELGYQTHIIIRLYEIMGENTQADLSPQSFEDEGSSKRYPKRFRISVSIGNGVMLDEIISEKEKDLVFEKLHHYDEPDFDLDHESTYSVQNRLSATGIGNNGTVTSKDSDELESNANTTTSEDNDRTISLENYERNWVSRRADVQLEPCYRMIPLWDNLEAASFDTLLHYSLNLSTKS